MRLIGFTGGMGVGKSTAIQCLREISYKPVHNIKFAQPLYDMQDYVYNRICKVYTPTPNFVKDRKLLQWLGTEWGRQTIKESLWIDLWKNAVQELFELPQHYEYEKDPIIVCDDVRFDNEAEAVKALGGKIIRITSDKAVARIDTSLGIIKHASENGVNLKYIDGSIDNSGTIEDLKSLLGEFNKYHPVW